MTDHVIRGRRSDAKASGFQVEEPVNSTSIRSIGRVELYRMVVRLLKGVAVALSASEARKRLFPLIEQVNDDEEAVEIVSKSGTAFLVPESLWRSMVETRYLLRSPANARRLMDSVARVEAGEFERRDLIPGGEELGRQAS